jgi:hypothetical protein
MMPWSQDGFGSGTHASAIGSSSDSAGGMVSGSYGETGFPQSGDSAAALSSDESLALEDGVYSDFYLVSFEPVPLQGWDYYVLDTEGSDAFAASDDAYWLIPTHELALIPSTSDEMVYELVLLPTGFDGSSDFATGVESGMGE